jgi:hypothetical protein
LTRAFSSSTSLLKMLSSKSHNWIEVVSTLKLVCPMGCFTLVLVAIVIIYILYYFLMIHCKFFLFDITIWYSQIRLIHIHKYFLWNYPGNTTCAEHINWAKQPDTFSIEFFSETVRGNLLTQDLNTVISKNTFHSVLRKLYTVPSIGASYPILVHLATRFQRRRFFRNN